MISKLDYEYSSPIDYFIYFLASKISPTLHELGFIPNDITNLSFISFVVSMVYIYINNIYLGIFFFGLNFFFDCLDGHMARNYNQVTVFGDWYDHITDLISILTVIIIIIYKLNNRFKYVLFLIGILVIYLLLMYIGCGERLLKTYNNNCRDSLSFTKKLCNYDINTVKKKIKYLRFFGHGQALTYMLFLLYLSFKTT